jgi:hypothetical protein
VTRISNCIVLQNSTTAFLIGGGPQETEYSPNSYFLNTAASTLEWIQGPTLNYGRDSHSCARIRKGNSNKFSIIVVGGYNGTFMTSVEILDESSNEWRIGPDLPKGIFLSTLVEDHAGGVILVGGNSLSDAYLQTLYRLSDAGDDSSWIEMPQKLKMGRLWHTSFLVPDDIVSCSAKQEE